MATEFRENPVSGYLGERLPNDLVPYYENAGELMTKGGITPTLVYSQRRYLGCEDTYTPLLGPRMIVRATDVTREILESVVSAGVAMANYLITEGISGCNESLIVEKAMRIEIEKHGGRFTDLPKNSA